MCSCSRLDLTLRTWLYNNNLSRGQYIYNFVLRSLFVSTFSFDRSFSDIGVDWSLLVYHYWVAVSCVGIIDVCPD